MPIKKIEDNANDVYIINENDGPVEFVQFSEFRKRKYIESGVATSLELIKREPQFANFPEDVIMATLLKNTINNWTELEAEIRATKFPNALKWVLNAPNKKRQVQQLKKSSFTVEEFGAFLFHAENQGYTYSQYHAVHYHRGLAKEKLPTLIDANVDPPRIVGETSLTEGELKQVISDRSVIASTFIDKGKEWHCFFATYESLKGEENWQNGQPHFHYLSDKFGIPRNEAVAQLTARDYHLGSLPHLKLLDYDTGPSDFT